MEFSRLELSRRSVYQPSEPSIDIIKSNLKHLNIRPKDVKDITKDAQNAYKMVFEQVLLVMRYVRQLMMHDSATIGRMNLLSTIFDNKREFDRFDPKELEEIQTGVLKKLEKNAGSNDVIAYLQSLESNASAHILMRIQENGVAFTPTSPVFAGSHSRPYTYYDMYTCLQHPLELFNKLLSQDIHNEKMIERSIYDRIKHHANSINPMGHSREAWHLRKNMSEDQQQYIFKLSKEENFAKIVKDYNPANKDIILQEVRGKLAIDIGKWASDIFSRISNPSFPNSLSGKNPWKEITSLDSFFKIHSDSDNTVISLDSVLLNNLHKINQLDDLFNSLKLAVKAKLGSNTGGRPWIEEQSINNKNALADISAWYERYSTGMLLKIDQIPKAIVSILYYDIEYNDPALKNTIFDAEVLKNIYRDSQERVDEKRVSPVRERNLLLTFIISLNLYLRDTQNKTGLDYLVERVKCHDTQRIVTGNDTLSTFTNSIMSSWSIFDHNEDGSLDASFGLDKQDRMMYRFKTIPVFFKKDISTELRELLWMISDQASTENPVPFPYNSAFPWPLWIKKSKGFSYRYISKTLGYHVYTESFIKQLL